MKEEKLHISPAFYTYQASQHIIQSSVPLACLPHSIKIN